jgi:hypothetical protein
MYAADDLSSAAINISVLLEENERQSKVGGFWQFYQLFWQLIRDKLEMLRICLTYPETISEPI